MKVKANGIAINYRIDGPERAPWLVFSNSLATSLAMWDEQAAAQKQGIEVLVEPTIARWFPAETVASNPPHLDKIRAMIRATPVNGFIGCAAALAAHDYASAVASVKCPTLFIVGEKDGATPA